MKAEKLVCKPVDSGNWKDLESLFESKGGPSYCWCMPYRNMNKGGDRNDKSDKKASLKHYVDTKTPVGLLYYKDSDPVAWCSIAPRDTFTDLSGGEELKDVWSIVCFYVNREHRKQGIMEELISQASKYAKKNGAKVLEAYPVDPDSPSYRFMGFKPVFEKAGFSETHKIGKRRYGMIKKI